MLAVGGRRRAFFGDGEPGGLPGGVNTELSAFRALRSILAAGAESTGALLPPWAFWRLLASLRWLGWVIHDLSAKAV